MGDSASTSAGHVYSALVAGIEDNTNGAEDGFFAVEVSTGGSGSEKLRVTSAGRLGIGTTSPSEKLQVNGNIQVGVGNSKEALIQGTNSGRVASNPAYSFSGDVDTGMFNPQTDNTIAFSTGGTERMRIDSSGRVGINTNSPAEKLHVVGQASFENAGNVNRGNIILGPHGNGTAKWATLAGTHFNDETGSGNGSGAAGCMIIGLNTSSGGNEVFVGGGPYELNPATAIRFYTHGTNLHNLGGSERMRLDSSGRLGIGTNSPSHTLDVVGNVEVSAGIFVANGAGISQFSCNHATSNADDWQISPISIRERGLVGSAQSANSYSPNINFHWASRVARSLTMLADGSFVLGEWTASGAPETTANLSPLNTGGYRINGTDVITSSRNIQQVGTITLGANGIIDTASGHIIFKSGGGTQGQFISTGFSLIGSYSATANFNTSLGGYQIGGTTVIDSSRNLTNIGTYAGNGDITLTSGSNQVLLAVTNGALEITRSAGGPFIDFKNSTSDDFDSRIMGGNALIFSTGGNGSTATALTLGSDQSATFAGSIITSKTSEAILLDSAHSKTKIGLFGGIGTGAEYIGTSANTVEISGTNINFNGASGSGTPNLKMGTTTVIDSSRNLTNIGTIATTDFTTATTAVTVQNKNLTVLGQALNISAPNSAEMKFFQTTSSTSASKGSIQWFDSSSNSCGTINLKANGAENNSGVMEFYVTAESDELGDDPFGINKMMSITENGVQVHGSLSKSSGSFKIDHPLKPDTHDLVHSFVEGPQADNLYRGVSELINGKIVIDLDDYFDMTSGTFLALNRDIQAFVNNEDGWDLVKAKVMGSQLIIESKNKKSSAKVSWLVIGERQDKEIYKSTLTDNSGRIIVEPEKVN